MSDPVSNADIEDVLSSIRRLISAGQSDQQDSGEAEAPVDNKLILTPAFRVFEGDRADTSDADQDGSASQFSTGRDIPVEKLEQDPASDTASEELSEAVEAADIPEIEDTLGLSPIDLSFDTDAVEPGLQSEADMPLPVADSQVDFEDNWDSAALGETAQVAFLHERMSRAALVAEEDAQAVEQVTETEIKAAPEPEQVAEVVEPVSTPEAIDEFAADPTNAPELADPVQDSATAADETTDLSAIQDGANAVIVETADAALAEDLEAQPVAEAGDADETDTGETDANESAAEDITPDLGAAEAAAIAAEDLTLDAVDDDAEPIVASVDVDDAPMAEIVDDDADFIDEAHLQEIVSRIVRDELKGEIGVKITQAVRRMVRREVTRALSLEKFED